MPVIFKEKKYNHLLIVIKTTIIILLLLVILVFTANYYLKTKIQHLKSEAELLREEKAKYLALLSKRNEIEKTGNKSKKYNLIVRLAEYAENIIYNSIHLKDNKITISAVADKQKHIFNLLENLKNDNKFFEVNLLNINQKDKYQFEFNTFILR